MTPGDASLLTSRPVVALADDGLLDAWHHWSDGRRRQKMWRITGCADVAIAPPRCATHG
jgi:hypothetical protein